MHDRPPTLRTSGRRNAVQFVAATTAFGPKSPQELCDSGVPAAGVRIKPNHLIEKRMKPLRVGVERPDRHRKAPAINQLYQAAQLRSLDRSDARPAEPFDGKLTGKTQRVVGDLHRNTAINTGARPAASTIEHCVSESTRHSQREGIAVCPAHTPKHDDRGDHAVERGTQRDTDEGRQQRRTSQKNHEQQRPEEQRPQPAPADQGPDLVDLKQHSQRGRAVIELGFKDDAP